MGNPNDLYADCIPPDASFLADVDADLHVAANFPIAAYG